MGIFYMQRAISNSISKTHTTPVWRTIRPTISVSRNSVRRFAGLFTLAVILGAWQLVTSLELVRPFLIPPPADVADKFYIVLTDGRLWLHTRTTLYEVLVGLGVGVGVAVLLGYMIAKSALLEDLLAPIIVTFQSTPNVAYAPLLIIWFGTGIQSKVIICALIVFFPMLMNTIVGLRSTPSDLHDLMRVSRATRWQIFAKLELPYALPVILTGLKTSATLAVIGAVVGEFIVAKAGLGFLVKLARDQYDTPLVFVAVLTLALLAGTLYGLVSLLERRLLAWKRRNG
jgi:NitT/TauT family transport system permease protein